MSLSLRDTQVDILTYQSSVTNGRTTDAWVVGSTAWGRIERPSGTKTYLNGAEEQRVDAVCAFGDDAVVDQKSLLRITGTTDVFKVLAVLPGRRRIRETHVYLAQTDKQQYPGLP
jgi:head-tail adaptor